MISNKLRNILVALTLVFALLGGAATAVMAEKGAVPYKKKCGDRAADSQSIDEERTTGDCSGTTPTPEPVSILLFTAGLAGIGFAARRRFGQSEETI
ncbi:MAG: PEP-CTERM sorting domain-containing protein [Chloracidobacterium sp.]|nr:PEP-CTERM sorting domain-containing protein [Chloracidobacterium sp.]